MHSIIDFWKKRDLPVVYTYVPEPAYRQKDGPEMLSVAADTIGKWEASGSNLPPVFLPDFGTVTMAKPWGGKVVKTDEGQIFINPVARSIDEALDIEPAVNPDIDRAVELYYELCRLTGRQDIRFVTPDFQGVLNTAAQVIKEEDLLVAMYTDPDKVHRFLDLVCRRNIDFINQLQESVGHIDGNIWPYIWVPQEVGVVITEDLMPLLSPEMYKEFGLPYLKRISDAFGGVFVHSCGNWIHNAKVMAESGINYLGIDFCYPYTKLEQIQEMLPGLVLQIGFEFNVKYEYESYPAFLDAMIRQRKGNTCLWAATNSAPVWQTEEIRAVLARHGLPIVSFCR